MQRGRRERSVARGRWAVQRERGHIAAPEPPAPFREAAPIGTLIPSVMQRLQAGAARWASELTAEWATVVGDPVSTHTRPGRLRQGHLTVLVDSPAWLNELSRFGRARILANLQQRFGDKVTSVAFDLDPEG